MQYLLYRENPAETKHNRFWDAILYSSVNR